MDSGKVKIVAMTTAGALAAYLLYKILTKGKATAEVGALGPFIGHIDPRSPVDVKQQEALHVVVEYIKNTFKGQPLQANASSGLFDEKDFKELLKAMNFYA